MTKVKSPDDFRHSLLVAMAKNYRGRSRNRGPVENKVGRAQNLGRLNVLLMGAMRSAARRPVFSGANGIYYRVVPAPY